MGDLWTGKAGIQVCTFARSVTGFFFGFLYSPISTVISIVMNIFSRKREYEADRFAVETTGKGEEMITALKKLSIDTLSNLTPHRLKVFFYYSHPPRSLVFCALAINRVGEMENKNLPLLAAERKCFRW